MTQRRDPRVGGPQAHPWDDAVTQIIPVNEFGATSAPAVGRDLFAMDVDVLAAPELDDLNDSDDQRSHVLLPPAAEFHRARRQEPKGPRYPSDRAQPASLRVAPVRAHGARRGVHRRKQEAAGAVHSRLIVTAIAAGAVAAGANVALDGSQAQPGSVLLAGSGEIHGAPSGGASGLQVVQVVSNVQPAVHQEELARGLAFAQERAQRESRLQRPQFVFPVQGILTSGFGARWGTLHAGLDIANAIGTPIYAASDGEVIASGPTPGYGMWVKIRGTDGAVTLYGHVDTTTVQLGERVLAGDQIATVGNRGNSTGPHLHFEVHLEGSEKTDPMAWLRARGVQTPL